MRHCPAQLILRDLFLRDGLDHVRPGDEHVRSLVHHQHEVGDRGRIHRASRARPHDRRNLRHHSAIQRVAQKNIRVSRQRHHAFLNPRSAGIVQPDYRRAHLRRQVHDLYNLPRIRFRQRSAKHGEVLRKHVHEPPFDAPVASDESVAVDFLFGHAEVIAAVGDQLVGFLERAFVEQKFDALARRHLAFFMLPLAALGPSTVFGQLVPLASVRRLFLRDSWRKDYSLWPGPARMKQITQTLIRRACCQSPGSHPISTRGRCRCDGALKVLQKSGHRKFVVLFPVLRHARRLDIFRKWSTMRGVSSASMKHVNLN